MKIIKNKGIGLVFILLAAVMWGTIGTLTRGITAFGFSSLSLIFYRSVVTCGILLVYMLVRDRGLLRIRLCDLWIFLGGGILSFFFFNVCYMLSIGVNSLAVSAILLYTSPIFVMLLSMVFFKERFTAKKAAALLLAVLGCALVSLSGDVRISAQGLVLGLGSGIGYALYSIFGTVALKRYNTVTITFYNFLFSAIAALFVADFDNSVSVFIGNVFTIPVVFGFACISTLFPYLLYTVGMSRNNATVASIVSCIEPVVAALLGFMVFSEKLTLLGVFGIVAVLLAIVILELPFNKSENTVD